MSKSRKISILTMALLLVASLFIGSIQFIAKADSEVDSTVGQFDFYLDAAELEAGDVKTTQEVKDGLFILQGSGINAISIDGNPKTSKDITDPANGTYYAFSKRIKFNGKSVHSTMERTISFYLDQKATIKVYALSSSSSDNSRTLSLYKNGSSTPIAAPLVSASDNILSPLVYETTEAGSYYFAADINGVNVYFIGVTYTGEATPVTRGPWADVANPAIGETSISQDGTTITVPFTGNIGNNGADKVIVYMYNQGESTPIERRTALRYGDSGSVAFMPSSSGSYVFKAEAVRAGEESKFSAESAQVDYVLPFAAPSVRARTGAEGKLSVTVTEVLEADEYSLNYRLKGEQTWTTIPLTATGTGEIVIDLPGFTVNDQIEIQANAKRTATGDSRDSTLFTAVLRPQEERDWAFTFFGQSTKDTLNQMVEGGNIFDGLTLLSATYDETGRAIGKGGKYTYGAHDGISFYYTKIDADKEDFRMKATVHVDYLNPTVDGQEGFALLVRDSIGTTGDTTYNYTNSAAALATKIQYKQGASNQTYKDGVGSRFVTGVQSSVDTPDSGSFKQVMYPLLNDTIYQGGEYIIELEKINNCYYTRYYQMDYKTNTETLVKENVLYHDENDKDQLLVIDKDYVYAGFSVARGCNATFSNIEFVTSERSTEFIEIQKEKVVGDYSITSPTTSSVNEYNFTFFANADGVLDVTLNGEAFITNQPITNYVDFVQMVTLVPGENNFQAKFTPSQGFCPSEYEVMASYDQVVVDKIVYVKHFGDASTPIYVAPDNAPDENGIIGSAANEGTRKSPVDLQTALNYCLVGQTIFLMEGTYEISSGNITIERGNNGTPEAYKVLRADPLAQTRPVLDYMNKGGGFTIWGDYWHLDGFDVTRTAYGKKGIQLGGKNNILENVNAYYNGDSGISVSGKSTDDKAKWPENNLVLNCTAYMNKDQAQEDADGFAAKLYCNGGNIFRGCISYCNADDGWDLYAKTESGLIGAVTIEDCIAFGNGFNIDGTETYGNGNGFKMGGESLPGEHKITNSIAFGNKKKGIDSNSCPDIIVHNCTSVYNGNTNYSFYSTKITSFDIKKVLSFVSGGSDDIPSQDENPILNTENYFSYTIEGSNSTVNSVGQSLTAAQCFEGWTDSRKNYFGFILSSNQIIEGDFEEIIEKITVRNADDSINLNGFLVVKEGVTESGARLSPIAGTEWDNSMVQAEPSGCKKGCKSSVGTIGSLFGFAVLAVATCLLLKKQKSNR